MDLTIEQLSKLTKLSIPTLRVYVSRQKLGKKVGNKRVYSQSDVQKLLKASKRSPKAKAAKSTTKKSGAGRKPVKAGSKRTSAAKPKADSRKPIAPSDKSKGRSFWARIFGGRKPKGKISLLDAKSTK